jgi:lipopolysaccharide export system protein LptA
VVATQGSTTVKADKVVVHFNPENKIDNLEALGHPAHFSTLTHLERERLVATANSIEFNPLQSTVRLINNAHVAQSGNVMDSPSILVDLAKETVVSKPSEKGRTTIVIQPEQLPHKKANGAKS